MKLRLYKKRSCYQPSFLGLVVGLLLILIAGRLLMPVVYKFLFLNQEVKTKTLVLEGWVHTYALKDAIDFFEENNYENLIVTGIPITQYEYASDFKYTSQATILAIKHFGYTDTIYEAANPTNIYKNRTYCTALQTKKIFAQHPEWDKSFNVYSMGVHSRRSLSLFKKAFPNNFNIGIIAHTDRAFIGEQWWKSSIGFRNISNELLALTYSKIFFYPEEKEYTNMIKEGEFFDKNFNARLDKQFEFTDTLRSPFNKEEIKHHQSFKYFEIDKCFNLKARFTVDTTHPVFEMPTTTERKPIYRIYGYFDFKIADTLCRLTAYQNMAYKNHPEHGRYLFVPFTDLSNGKLTYGGGRYLDIPIPTTDSTFIDFNETYNPYCAYSERWSCPLVPFNNNLNISINAGEMKYK